MPIRTFIALEIPSEPLENIIAIRENTLGKSFKAKWEPKEKLHLTIKFLGDTEQSSIEEIENMFDAIMSEYKPFELMFEKFGIFRKGNDPKIFWIGMKPNSYLNDFANELNLKCSELGFESEKRAFKSHITLLRFRGYEDSEKVLSLTKVILPEIKFIADKVIFFESKLLPSGSIYKPIKSFYLKN